MNVKSLLASGYRVLLSKPHVPPEDPLILVMIPLLPKARAEDWGRVCAILEDTLNSLRAQSYRRFEILLCSQDRPENFPDAPGYHFVTAPPHTAAANVSDQRVKVRLLAEYAAAHFDEFTYVMHLDADDLLHPDLFGFVAGDNNGRGYLVEQGYMVDASSGRIAPLGRAIGGALDFWEHCGSCAFFAVDWGRQRLPVFYMRLIGKGHKSYAERCARLGYPLAPVPFPAMLYVVNHGDNMQIRKGNDKSRYLDACEITDEAEKQAVRAEFGLRG
ncbi:glycosyltransferase family A protein [Celeribacter indicus]|uniref:Glycosyltransferase 2-like domain-containing protein n=1 Tax=Celeribacter indicus TaxID=1208324 RepID=A0A0B5DZ04_9RHOB|nr:glycosyltransferase family 2 protein [Celeribacter indicus]AJE46415.1 hypothetical protein P73_1700 [Celeribacter indicus]SDW56090.1 hypothetical protein SAMN05443573_104255 [Celeribacter indicus]